MNISEKLKLNLVELDPDKDMDFRTWLGIFAGVGANNLQKIDDFADHIDKAVQIIKDSPSTVFVDAKKQTTGIYRASVPDILTDKTDLIANSIYIIRLDVSNETTMVSLRINDTIGKQLKKIKTDGTLSDLDIGDIQCGLEHVFRYDGQYLVLINANALTFMNKQIKDFVLKDEVVDNLAATDADIPLSANQGRILKELINTIQTLLTSNDPNLDELQKIVDYIKSNKSLIEQLTIDKINVSDIKNDLLSIDIDKPLSANVGKILDEKISSLQATSSTHTNNKENPHEVTKTQVGLSNLTNDAQVKRIEMGVQNGVATLDDDGAIPDSQLPSSVHDVFEFELLSQLPAIGEYNKIYIVYGDTKANNGTYRWSSTSYVMISNPLDIATQKDALDGTDNTKIMTPLQDKHIS